MYFEEIEIGKVYKAETSKTVTGTEIYLVCQLSGMDLPGFWTLNLQRDGGSKAE